MRATPPWPRCGPSRSAPPPDNTVSWYLSRIRSILPAATRPAVLGLLGSRRCSSPGAGPSERGATATEGAAATDRRSPPPRRRPPPDRTAARPEARLGGGHGGPGTFVRVFHPEPVLARPRADLRRRAGRRPGRLVAMDEVEATVEVMRLAALIDGHTGVYPSRPASVSTRCGSTCSPTASTWSPPTIPSWSGHG